MTHSVLETQNTETTAQERYKSYMTGFVWAVILTIIPFSLVMLHVPATLSVAAIVICGFTQAFAQLRYFLHLKMTGETRPATEWGILAAIVILMLVIGSMWIMIDTYYRMLPV